MGLNPNVPVVNAGLLYVNGLTLTYSSTSLLTISAGAARDSKDINDIVLSAPLVINTAKSGLNGVQGGIIQPTQTYAVYLLGDSTKYKPTAAILYLDSAAPISEPSLPLGYDMFRRIGWIATNSTSQIVKFYQYGKDEIRNYYYDVSDDNGTNVLNGGSSSTYAEVRLFPVVPPIVTEVTFTMLYQSTVSTSAAHFNPVSSIDPGDEGSVKVSSGTAAVIQKFQVKVPGQIGSFGSPSIYYKVGVGDVIALFVKGYVDYLS